MPWSSISSALGLTERGAERGGVRSAIDWLLENLGLTTTPAPTGSSEPDARSTVGFTIAIIALAAKLSKADGVSSPIEVATFFAIYQVPPAEKANVARLFDQASQDDIVRILTGAAAGLDDYRRVGGLGGLHDRQSLFHVVDIERRHAVALLGGMVQKLSQRDPRHVKVPLMSAPVYWASVYARRRSLQSRHAGQGLTLHPFQKGPACGGDEGEFIRDAGVMQSRHRVAAARDGDDLA